MSKITANWTIDQVVEYGNLWQQYCDMNNGRLPVALRDDEREIAYELGLLPRPAATVEVIYYGPQHWQRCIVLRREVPHEQ